MTTNDFRMGPNDWDAAAVDYARGREPLTLPYGLDTLAALRIEPGERLIDLATGTGGVALAAARRGAKVVAVDWSPGMVGFLAARAKGEGVENLQANVMDGQNLDLPASQFDAACSVFGVMYFPDHRAGLAELRRVLRPGGRVALAVWQCPSRMGHLAVWERAVRSVDPDFSGFPRPDAWVRMDTKAGLQAEMEAAGFRNVAVALVAHRLEVPSARWFVENFDTSQAFRDRFGPAGVDRLRAAVLAELRNGHGDAPFTLTAHAHIGTATR